MTVAALSAALAAKGLPTTGRKPALVARLTDALAAKAETQEEDKKMPATPEPLPLPTTRRRRGGRSRSGASSGGAVAPAALFAVVDETVEVVVRPGTAHLGAAPASARGAAREKRRAGENRAVEHVALHDEEELAEVETAASSGGQGGGGRKRRKTAVGEGKGEGGGKGKASGRREWAAEVAVPGSVGLMDEVLLAGAVAGVGGGEE